MLYHTGSDIGTVYDVDAARSLASPRLASPRLVAPRQSVLNDAVAIVLFKSWEKVYASSEVRRETKRKTRSTASRARCGGGERACGSARTARARARVAAAGVVSRGPTAPVTPADGCRRVH